MLFNPINPTGEIIEKIINYNNNHYNAQVDHRHLFKTSILTVINKDLKLLNNVNYNLNYFIELAKNGNKNEFFKLIEIMLNAFNESQPLTKKETKKRKRKNDQNPLSNSLNDAAPLNKKHKNNSEHAAIEDKRKSLKRKNSS